MIEIVNCLLIIYGLIKCFNSRKYILLAFVFFNALAYCNFIYEYHFPHFKRHGSWGLLKSSQLVTDNGILHINVIFFLQIATAIWLLKVVSKGCSVETRGIGVARETIREIVICASMLFLTIMIRALGWNGVPYFIMALSYSLPFILLEHKRITLVSILLALVLFLSRGSKGDIVFVLVWLFAYGIKRFDVKSLIFLGIAPVIAGVNFLSFFIRVNYVEQDYSLSYQFLKREYSYEVLYVMSEHISILPRLPLLTLLELMDLIPGFLLPIEKINSSRFLFATFLPSDFIKNTGYYTGFITVLLYDYGYLLGFILYAFLVRMMIVMDNTKVSYAFLALIIGCMEWIVNGQLAYSLVYLITFTLSKRLVTGVSSGLERLIGTGISDKFT